VYVELPVRARAYDDLVGNLAVQPLARGAGVTILTLGPASGVATASNRAVVRFYNKRGRAEQWIKEGKQAHRWQLQCRSQPPLSAGIKPHLNISMCRSASSYRRRCKRLFCVLR
jgi:hypothetical protein